MTFAEPVPRTVMPPDDGVGRGAASPGRLEDTGERGDGDACSGEQGETSELHWTLPSVV